MKKLISKNPVQRFKIIKAQQGTLFETIGKGKIKTNNYGHRYYVNAHGNNIFENGDVYDKSGKFLKTDPLYRNQYDQKNAKLQKSNNQNSISKSVKSVPKNQSKTNSPKSPKNQTNVTTPSRVQKRVNTVTSPKFKNTEIQKGSDLLYTWGKTEGSKGLDAVGVQKGWRDSDRFNKFMQGKSDDDNMQGENDIYDYLVEANGGNHFGNTQELQKFINSKLSELSKKNYKNYGSIVVDNKFGNQTEEGARLVYELLKNGPTQNAYMAPTSQVTSNKYSNPGMQFNKAATRGFLNSINARYTDDLISGIMNMNKDDLTKQQIYSRAGITSDMDENAIRDRLGNTFAQLGIHGHLGGNDKRRFRNWFNTQETPQSTTHIQTPESVVHIQTPTRNLFSGLDNWNKQIKSRYSFLKKGGLISKNPVERFNQSFTQGAGQ